MAKTSYARNASARKKTTPARRASHNSYNRGGDANLTTEQQLDFIGVFITIIGILCLVAFFSKSNGPLTGWVAQSLGQIAGLGGFLIPVMMTIGGIYLILRRVERLPRLSSGRTLGIFLLYLNVLTWIHFFDGGGFSSARAGNGGGYLGGAFDSILHSSLGAAGEVVVLVAWLLISVVFVLNFSVNEIVAWLSTRKEKEENEPRIAVVPQRVRAYANSTRVVPERSASVPHGFNPLDLSGEAENMAQPRKSPEVISKPVLAKKPVQPASVDANVKKENTPVVHTGITTAKKEKAWAIPAVADVLDPATQSFVQSHVDKERAQIIEETLASLSAPAHVVAIHRGPAVTQFGVEPDFIENRTGRTRVRVSKIVGVADDLALMLEAPSIRIQAPVPGKAYVGIEVPNTELALVSLRELIENEAFRKIKSPLRFALGKDVSGKPVCADLTAMPHMLIAGTTNSGKSVLVNAILTSLLLNNSPADLRLLLVDPKRVELTGYNGIPHLLVPVVVEAEKVVGALQWVLREMDRRYKTFANAGVRNIVDYNRKEEEHLPYLVIVIDELADLMMLAPDDTERSITRLAQLARATGIHLIIATQRPSVDVVTGLIKANFPARVAFMVASNADSRVILDQPGAEKLLGKGDMLYQAPDAPSAVRLQGVYVSDPEIQRLVDAWRVIALNRSAEGVEEPDNIVVDLYTPSTPLKQGELFDEEGHSIDPLLEDAKEIVRREGKASISMLQRKMRVGYTRAARLIDTLEKEGIIGPQQHGSQVREVLENNKEPAAEESEPEPAA